MTMNNDNNTPPCVTTYTMKFYSQIRNLHPRRYSFKYQSLSVFLMFCHFAMPEQPEFIASFYLFCNS